MEDIASYYYSWNDQFYYFTLFRTLNGPGAVPGRDCHDPIDDSTDYTQANLSAWIKEQNRARKAGSGISGSQIRVLDGANFPWIRDSNERWDGQFRELVEYKQKHGNCNVPRSEGRLGIWVKNQRAAYHKIYNSLGAGDDGGHDVKKTTATITPDQVRQLNDLGFEWKVRPEHADVFDGYLECLRAYIEQQGNCNVSTKEHPALGRWVCKMRYLHKQKAEGKKNALTDDMIARLEGIGFVWRKEVDLEAKRLRKEEANRKKNEKRKREREENRLKRQMEAEEAAAAAGDLSAADDADGASPKKKKKSTAKRPREGNDSEKKPAVSWDDHYRDLVDYKREHGNCNVPRSEGRLGIWVKNQRAAYRKLHDDGGGGDVDGKAVTRHKITPEQVELLEGLGFQWKVRQGNADAFDGHLESLRAFMEEHGHCDVSSKEHPVLGKWVCNMRYLYRLKAEGKKTSMTDEKIARLEEAGFVWVSKATSMKEEKKRAAKRPRGGTMKGNAATDFTGNDTAEKPAGMEEEGDSADQTDLVAESVDQITEFINGRLEADGIGPAAV